MIKKPKNVSEKPARDYITRRDFIQKTGLGLAGVAAISHLPVVPASASTPEFEIKVGVIGCGGRGTGAALDVVQAATTIIYPLEGYHTEDAAQGAKAQAKNIKIVSLADLFPDRLSRCREQLHKVGIEVEDPYCFTGFDAYQKLLAIKEINYVILTEPPHFRPQHLRAAIEAGKNVFLEKPAAVDVAGVRSVIESGEMAKKKGLAIGAGTQRRHENATVTLVKKIHDGEIGDIVSANLNFMIGELWSVDREPGWSDFEFQLRNWLYYNWLGGDMLVEQFIHPIDMMNWIMKANPLKAVGLGGRQVRTDPKFGNIYDHYTVRYEYPNGIMVFCLDRQINGCYNMVKDVVYGTKGRAIFGYPVMIEYADGQTWRYRDEANVAYQTEHEVLIRSIKDEKPINEAQQVAESTLTAIMGREAAYTGRELDWDTVMKAQQDFKLKEYKFGAMEVPPVPLPGKYTLV